MGDAAFWQLKLRLQIVLWGSGGRMFENKTSWHTKYWDAVDQLYWSPAHLGLVSIPIREWGEDEQDIRILRSRVKNGSTIYTRSGSSAENAVRLRSLEETLNHIFDITFAIAPDAVIAELFHRKLSIPDSGPFLQLGREIGERYGWGFSNVTQQDGFFVSQDSIVAVELKLGARTSKKQLLQYVGLMMWEERLTGRKKDLGLLYVTPSEEAPKVWAECGATPDGAIPAGLIDEVASIKFSPKLQTLFAENHSDLEDTIARVKLQHVSWKDLTNSCTSIMAQLDLNRVGDDTLGRLLAGFVNAVMKHNGAFPNGKVPASAGAEIDVLP